MIIWAAELNYIHPSGLSTEEKDDAHVTFGRLSRGKKAGKISNSELTALQEPYTVIDEEGNKVIKQNPTDEEIRAFLASAKKLLSKNEVSEEPLKLDIANELKEALDEAGVP